ncbi:MAG TPA: DUF1810 domain-containing protein [Cytophagaceae bacterium]|jgi:uncharacterized protein (DUF1810 family)
MESILTKFIKAQEKDFETAFAEIKSGRKRSHWMWYIFPQFNGLGVSETSKYYSIKTLEEAKQFLSHPILGTRLERITIELLKNEHSDAKLIFGSPDYLKLHSSMTLFSIANDAEANNYKSVLVKFFKGKSDDRTIKLIESQNNF